MEFGLLLIRAVVGLALAAHGAQKLFGAFGGHGLAGTGGWFESIGFRPGKPMAAMAGLGELGGGLLLALGLLTPLAAAAIIAVMVAATLSVHLDKGFFGQDGGYELPAINAAAAAGLAFIGPGPISLDAALGIDLAGATWGVIALLLGAIGGVVPVLLRRRRQASVGDAGQPA